MAATLASTTNGNIRYRIMQMKIRLLGSPGQELTGIQFTGKNLSIWCEDIMMSHDRLIHRADLSPTGASHRSAGDYYTPRIHRFVDFMHDIRIPYEIIRQYHTGVVCCGSFYFMHAGLASQSFAQTSFDERLAMRRCVRSRHYPAPRFSRQRPRFPNIWCKHIKCMLLYDKSRV